MIDNTSKEPESFDSSHVAVGDLTYDQVGIFMSVYVSALRSLTASFRKEGADGCLIAGYRMLANQMVMLDASVVGEEAAKSAKEKLSASTMAIGQALSSVMSKTAPLVVGELCETALDCLDEVVKEKGDEVGGFHLIFHAENKDGKLALNVSGVRVEDVAKSAESIMSKNKKDENIIKLNGNN